ncbi:hypothetical protein CHS0354_020868 [Potamilus streckersoni]|uniref:G patch domain-containing protein 4 n=1 Tax=Potamilus streckersoni TaxID=2493646 RepID=A0AAE0SGD9_9BIVA|nr:hypothetical protein CHS0354_020868 [Potamilus streckersoni]
MAHNNFAHNQLLKHGWKEGSGLGKAEDGIKEAIKVKIKNDTAGVGHDPGADFTFHWWDHVFNKAAGSIHVKNTENGVEVKKVSADNGPVISKKRKTYDKKNMLYGQFVKGATLSDGSYEAVPGRKEESSDEEEKTKNKTAIIPANEQEIFKLCGGLTAHKAARHGHKLNGKLSRVEEQERLLVESMKRTLGKHSNDKITSSDTGGNYKCEESNMAVEQKSGKKKNKKKRKYEQLNLVDANNGFEELTNNVSVDNEIYGQEQAEAKPRKSGKFKKMGEVDTQLNDEQLTDNSLQNKKKKMHISSLHYEVLKNEPCEMNEKLQINQGVNEMKEKTNRKSKKLKKSRQEMN